MQGKKIIIISTMVVLISASGCAKQQKTAIDYFGKRPTTGEFFNVDETPLVEINYKAADKISAQLEEVLPAGSPITVNLFRMRGSSLQTDFAKITTEQIASRIAQKGNAVVADNSRFSTQSADADSPAPIKCTLAGAYTVGPELIYMTAAITSLDDGEILGSWDWTVPLNGQTRSLLPIKDDGTITPLVNTSGPLANSGNANITFQPNYDSRQGSIAPGFEQNILE